MALDVNRPVDKPAALRSAIAHLSARERATLHLLHHRCGDAVIDLRETSASLPFASAGAPA